MFERYDEKARRVIFFARYEASQRGADHIGTAHLLLALFREDKPLFEKHLGVADSVDEVASRLELKRTGEEVNSSVDIPLSVDAKRALAHAAEEATELRHRHIATGHVLLGLLREPCAANEFLKARGLDLDAVRRVVKKREPGPVIHGMDEPPSEATVHEKIVGELRRQFKELTRGLKPEMEPAVEYRLEQ